MVKSNNTRSVVLGFFSSSVSSEWQSTDRKLKTRECNACVHYLWKWAMDINVHPSCAFLLPSSQCVARSFTLNYLHYKFTQGALSQQKLQRHQSSVQERLRDPGGPDSGAPRALHQGKIIEVSTCFPHRKSSGRQSKTSSMQRSCSIFIP